MIGSSRAAWLRAVGRYLRRHNIQNAFLAIAIDGITLTPVTERVPFFSVMLGDEELDGIAGSGTAGLLSPVEELLMSAGSRMDEHNCHTAFLVLYDGMLIVDFGNCDQPAIWSLEQPGEGMLTADQVSHAGRESA